MIKDQLHNHTGKTSRQEELVSEEQEIIAQVILSNSTFIYTGTGLLSVQTLLQWGTASHLNRYTPKSHCYSFQGFDRDMFMKAVLDTAVLEKIYWQSADLLHT